MQNLNDIQVAIALIEPSSPIAHLASTIQALDNATRRARELKADMEKSVMEWIETNGPFTVGDIRYSVGTKREVKCKDVKATLVALLGMMDMDQLAGCLASAAWKHGTIRKTLAELKVDGLFDELFEVVEKAELKEGKPAKQLLAVNTRFLD